MSSDKNETRNRILQAVCDLVAEHKGSGVRMTDVAKRSGISRQAVYLHFETRADLLISATRYVDEVNGFGERMAFLWQDMESADKLRTYIGTWGNYIPEIHPIATALIAMKDTDDAAAAAWNNRMQALREGCEIVVTALKKERRLTSKFPKEDAINLFWMQLSVENWERLTKECGWSQKKYVTRIQELASSILIRD